MTNDELNILEERMADPTAFKKGLDQGMLGENPAKEVVNVFPPKKVTTDLFCSAVDYMRGFARGYLAQNAHDGILVADKRAECLFILGFQHALRGDSRRLFNKSYLAGYVVGQNTSSYTGACPVAGCTYDEW